MKETMITTLFILITILINAQEYSIQTGSAATDNYIVKTAQDFEIKNLSTDSIKNADDKFFIAYELGEAIFNKFQSYSGEVGIRFKNQHKLKLVHLNINLTEAHLSSNFAGAVDGENVEGKQFGFELFYGFPVLIKGLYLSPSIGHYNSKYQHTVLNQKIEKASFSLGTAISYTETNIFKIKGLYYSFSIPMRINLNPIEETQLGTAIVTNNTFDNNIWMFIGYEF